MVALYGSDYTVTDLSEVANIVTGTHYKYDLSGHNLEIWFETDAVSAWNIGKDLNQGRAADADAPIQLSANAYLATSQT